MNLAKTSLDVDDNANETAAMFARQGKRRGKSDQFLNEAPFETAETLDGQVEGVCPFRVRGCHVGVVQPLGRQDKGRQVQVQRV